jgi:hypothetical protein
LFELGDAALSAPHRSTLVRLSLTTVFRRRWPSTCDALADGSIDVPGVRLMQCVLGGPGVLGETLRADGRDECFACGKTPVQGGVRLDAKLIHCH